MTVDDSFSGRARRLEEVARFTEVLARIQADTSLHALRKGAVIVAQQQESLHRLWALGQLTPAVEQELATATRLALDAVADLAKQTGSALTTLSATTPPRPAKLASPLATDRPPLTRGEKISHWWEHSALPWWRGDSL